MDNIRSTLEELDQMFADRYTSRDEAFRQYCSQPISDPPVIANWMDRPQFERENSRNSRRFRETNYHRRGRDRSWHDCRR
ncbi:hypothetical protein FBUS_10796 [Fasciolopsis buskii]|uniref:Uncharacterized protein n=1 Tax=Fasciolopsis buskii TaxID=27845 RepID=A0A8E0RPQ9_9TREM|nr:hypothetical protein FBUS_10796 [Fasciolopsis buski]